VLGGYIPAGKSLASVPDGVHGSALNIFVSVRSSGSNTAGTANESLVLKSTKEFNYIGKAVPIVELQDMTTGNTTYGVDVHLQGMLYASIERSPFLDVLAKDVSTNPGEVARQRGGMVGKRGIAPIGSTFVEGEKLMSDGEGAASG